MTEKMHQNEGLSREEREFLELTNTKAGLGPPWIV